MVEPGLNAGGSWPLHELRRALRDSLTALAAEFDGRIEVRAVRPERGGFEVHLGVDGEPARLRLLQPRANGRSLARLEHYRLGFEPAALLEQDELRRFFKEAARLLRRVPQNHCAATARATELQARRRLFDTDRAWEQQRFIEGFDPAKCPIAAGEMAIEPESALVEGDGGYALYAPKSASADALPARLDKNVYGRVRLHREGGAEDLRMHSACGDCRQRWRCAVAFQRGDAAQPEDPTLSLTWDGGRVVVDALEGLEETLAAEPESLELNAPVSRVHCREEGAPSPPARRAGHFAAPRIAETLRRVGYHPSSETGAAPLAGGRIRIPFRRRGGAATRLKVAVLAFNGRCVTLCRYCRLPQLFSRDMPAHDAIAALEELSLVGARGVDLFGGEVTLRDDLELVVEVAAILGLRPKLISTGARLDPARCTNLVDLGLSEVYLSLDSPDRETHDFMKGKGGLHEAALVALRTLGEDGRIPLNVNCVLHPESYTALPGLGELVGEAGATDLRLFHCVTMEGGGMSHPHMSPDALRRFYETILPGLKAELEAYGGRVHLSPARRDSGEREEREAFYERVSKGLYNERLGSDEPCTVVGNSVFIGPELTLHGCVNPTLTMKKTPEHEIGRLGERSLPALLSEAALVEFRRLAGRLPECAECFQTHDPVAPMARALS